MIYVAMRWWRIVAYVLVAFALAIPVGTLVGFRFIVTPSVPMGIWFVRSGPIVRGAYVSACLPERIASIGLRAGYLDRGPCDGALAVMKRVVAISGDRVSLGASGLAVNGRIVPGSRRLSRDTHGRPVAGAIQLRPSLVREDQVWLLGDYYKSWDSRYYGPIPIVRVLGIGIPLVVRSLQT